MNTSFSVRASTIGQLIQADNMTQLQKRLGLSALIELAEDAVLVKIGHGSAVALAAILKDGGLNAARSKYYSEKACQIAAAIQYRAVLACSKVRGEPAKAEARKISETADFAELASMASISAAQAWAKKNGPKAEKAKAEAEAEAEAEATVDNQPSHEAIEQAGQLREVREIMQMVVAGQLADSEALASIAQVLGMAKTSTADTAKAKASKAAMLKAS